MFETEPPSSDASFLAPADSPDRVEIYKQYVNEIVEFWIWTSIFI